MYILNEVAKSKLKYMKYSDVARTIGINAETLSEMVRKDRPCLKLPAYAITKFLDSEKEISDFFDRKVD
jgi:hypothetical protein